MAEPLDYASSASTVKRSIWGCLAEFLCPRILLGVLLLVAAAQVRIDWVERSWARVFASFDSRMTAYPNDVGYYVEIIIPVRLFWRHPGRAAKGYLYEITPWETGLPVMGAVFPLLISRWKPVPVVVALVSSVAMTAVVTWLRFGLVYVSLFTKIPHFEVVHWRPIPPVDVVSFGFEVILCLFLCVQRSYASHANPIRG